MTDDLPKKKKRDRRPTQVLVKIGEVQVEAREPMRDVAAIALSLFQITSKKELGAPLSLGFGITERLPDEL